MRHIMLFEEFRDTMNEKIGASLGFTLLIGAYVVVASALRTLINVLAKKNAKYELLKDETDPKKIAKIKADIKELSTAEIQIKAGIKEINQRKEKYTEEYKKLSASDIENKKEKLQDLQDEIDLMKKSERLYKEAGTGYRSDRKRREELKNN